MKDRKKFLICESRFTSPYRNLAAEEYLTRTLPDNTSIMFLWQNDNTIVIGKNQNCYAECRVAELAADGGHLARRLSGGGAVRHDMGNLCFSFIARGEDYDVQRQLSVIAAACREFGIDAQPTGRNDITADGAKFSGNAFFSVGDAHCHHGTVLIDCDFGAMARYLTVKKSKLQAKGIESVRSRVVNLNTLCEGLTVPASSPRSVALCGNGKNALLSRVALRHEPADDRRGIGQISMGRHNAAHERIGRQDNRLHRRLGCP